MINNIIEILDLILTYFNQCLLFISNNTILTIITSVLILFITSKKLIKTFN